MVALGFVNVVHNQKTFIATLATYLAAVFVAFLDGLFEIFFETRSIWKHRATALPVWIRRTFARWLNVALSRKGALPTTEGVGPNGRWCSPYRFSARFTRVPLTGDHLRMWTALCQAFTFSTAKNAGVLVDLRWLAGEGLAAMHTLRGTLVDAIPSLYLVLRAQLGKTFGTADMFAVLGKAGLERYLCSADSASDRNPFVPEPVGAVAATEMMLVGKQAAGWTINRPITVSA